MDIEVDDEKEGMMRMGGGESKAHWQLALHPALPRVVWCGCIVLDITDHITGSPVAFVLIQFRKHSVIQR